MKIYIMVDMEGISGVCRASQVQPGTPEYARAQHYLTADTNVCINACFEAGAKDVVVRDCHSAGHNMLWDELDKRVDVIQGAARGQRMPGLKGCDGLILLGYHAMAGTLDAVLEHTMSSKGWQHFWFNGKKVGEIVIDAAIAAEYDVPTIMVSGDDKVCKEAKRDLPGVVTAEVKKGLHIEGARMLPQAKAHQVIHKSTLKAVGRCGSVKPYGFKSPVTMRLERATRAGDVGARPGVKILDARTTEIKGSSPEQMFFSL